MADGTKQTRRRHTADEKKRAVELAKEQGVCAAARELGIPQAYVSRWVALAGSTVDGPRESQAPAPTAEAPSAARSAPSAEPPTSTSVPLLPDVSPILRACRDFLYDHPGSVGGTGAGRRYTDAFRRFVLDLLGTHRDVSLGAFADGAGVPVATLRTWQAGGMAATTTPPALAAIVPPDPTQPRVETLVSLWATWRGSFGAICRHANEDWRLPFRKTLIAEILAAHGVRFARRRSGRSPDEDALRGQFLTYFPNAQWVGDGALVTTTIDGQTFPFNLELVVDPSSGAFVGATVTDPEDAAAIVVAVRDAQATTGATPLSVLLDNKPSNHAEEVREALEPVGVEPATPDRPQNKAHVEGGFGLFRQIAPAIAMLTGHPRAIARTLVELVVVTRTRTLNHRRPKPKGGRSRVQRHRNHEPTAEEIEARPRRAARATVAAGEGAHDPGCAPGSARPLPPGHRPPDHPGTRAAGAGAGPLGRAEARPRPGAEDGASPRPLLLARRRRRCRCRPPQGARRRDALPRRARAPRRVGPRATAGRSGGPVDATLMGHGSTSPAWRP